MYSTYGLSTENTLPFHTIQFLSSILFFSNSLTFYTFRNKKN